MDWCSSTLEVALGGYRQLFSKHDGQRLTVCTRCVTTTLRLLMDGTLSKSKMYTSAKKKKISDSTGNGEPPRHLRLPPSRVLPWSIKATNTANCRSLMYGDLAEIPSKQPTRSSSCASSSMASNGTTSKHSRVKTSSRTRQEDTCSWDGSETEDVIIKSSQGRDVVSREEWEYVWNQYQQLSRTMQEALKQRTAELT